MHNVKIRPYLCLLNLICGLEKVEVHSVKEINYHAYYSIITVIRKEGKIKAYFL